MVGWLGEGCVAGGVHREKGGNQKLGWAGVIGVSQGRNFPCFWVWKSLSRLQLTRRTTTIRWCRC